MLIINLQIKLKKLSCAISDKLNYFQIESNDVSPIKILLIQLQVRVITLLL